MKWFLTGSLLIMIIASCQQRPASLEVLEKPLIQGNPPAVLLDVERTVIPLGTYVTDPIRIDSVTFDGPFNYDIDNANMLLLGRPKKPLYVMILWADGIGESMVLKRTKKTLHTFFYRGKADGVKVRGDFNDWDENKTIMRRSGDVFTTYLLLSPGRYEYQFLVDGKETLDVYSISSVRNDSGSENSVIEISGSDSTKLPILKLESLNDNLVTLSTNKRVDGVYAFWNNTLIPKSKIIVEDVTVTIEVPGNAIDAESSLIRVWAEDADGASNQVAIELRDGKMISSPQTTAN